MDHQEAVRSQTTEKYLLGELRGAERDGFEDHFFECEECAEAVRTGILLMDNGAAESLGTAAYMETPAQPKTAKSWKDWLRFEWRQPAFALPALALIAVSGLWVTDHTRMANELAVAAAPQTFGELQLDRTRGATAVAVNREGRYFAVSFYINHDNLPAYAIEISGGGVSPASLQAQTQEGGRYYVLLPSSRYKAGQYAITIKGGAGTDGRFVQQFPLSIK